MVTNKRRHKRVSFIKEIDIQCPHNEIITAIVVNISRSGIATYCSKPPEVGCEVALNLLFADEYKVDRAEVVIGKVCWVKTLEDFYAAGIKFESLNEHKHFMTLAYLDYAEGFEQPYLSE